MKAASGRRRGLFARLGPCARLGGCAVALRALGLLCMGFSLVLSLQGCVTGVSPATMRQRGLDAEQAFREQNWPKAQVAYKAYIGDAGFKRLPEGEQFQALRSAAFVGLYHGDREAGYAYLVRLVAMSQSDDQAWTELLRDAHWLKHDADAVRSLVVLAQRWPDTLLKLDDTVVAGALRGIAKLPRDVQLRSLWALYQAHFKLKWNVEPSWSWRMLTLLLLEHERLADASQVLEHITDAEALMTMRVDNRFEALVAANPARFDIEAAAREQLRLAQETSDQHPDILALKLEVVSCLRHLRDYEAMLAATDELVYEVESTNFPQRLYTDADYDDQYRWLLNLRALALERIGQAEASIAQLQAASRLSEEGAKNVSQVINLGELFCRLKRPQEALAAIVDVGPLSAHGTLEIESIRLEAAVQLGDAPQIEKSLKFMQAHGADGPDVLERAWVLAGRGDLAAAHLIGRLLNPAEREGALRSVQDFAPIPETEWETQFDARWSALLARQDVAAAIRKVGRAETFRLELFD
jgi:hypothetical protein